MVGNTSVVYHLNVILNLTIFLGKRYTKAIQYFSGTVPQTVASSAK